MEPARSKSIDGVQGLVALAGITFGAIPLVRWVASGEHGGLFRWLFGEHTGAMGLGAPLIVILVAVGAVAALEVWKRRH